jgi:mycothiol synthase
MRLEALQMDRLEEFVAFCKKHKSKVDESFLYDDELQSLQPNEENPTYVVLNERNEMIAAASLIMDEYNRRGKKARFRIFFSEVDAVEIYKSLLESFQKYKMELEKLFIFVPLVNGTLMSIMEALQFELERYTYLLIREAIPVSSFSLPDGYTMRPFQYGDEEAWATVRNAAFAQLKGSETPITPEMVTKMTQRKDYLEGGMILLFHNDQLVGVVRGTDDEYEDAPIMNIGPVAVLPEYQGKGLGRILLRASLQYAADHHFKRTILCVNGENERAQALYIQEGFKQVEGVACYNFYL